jgi:malic enzyme
MCVDLGIFSARLGDAFGADGDGELLRLIFHALDADGDGLLSFSDFVVGLSHIFRGADEEVLSFAFRMYDTRREGALRREQLGELLRGLMRQHGEAWGQRKWSTPLEDLLDAILQPPTHEGTDAGSGGAAAATGSPGRRVSENNCAAAASARAAAAALKGEVRDLLTRFSAGRHLAVSEGGLSRAQYERLLAAVKQLPPSDPASAVSNFLAQPWTDVAAQQLFANAPWRAFLASVAASIDTKPHTLESLDTAGFISAMTRLGVVPTRSHRALGVRLPARLDRRAVSGGPGAGMSGEQLEPSAPAAYYTLGIGGAGGGKTSRFNGEASVCALGVDEREVLALLGEELQVEAGGVVIEQGGALRAFFFLLDGTVALSRGDGGGVVQQLAQQGPGTFLGESALFTADVKASTLTDGGGSAVMHTAATAVTPCRLVKVGCSAFFALLHSEHSGAAAIMQRLGAVMVARLQDIEDALDAAVAGSDAMASSRMSRADWSALRRQLLAAWSLKYHRIGKRGKLEVNATKFVGSKEDLSVAYSPGVAEPCLAIAKNPDQVYEYTCKGHLVGVVTNGSAVLGLGNIGPLAAKPVMEGKAVLFKKFADIDCFDIELAVADNHPHLLCEVIAALEPTFGGINLEDIKAPECFLVERECQARMNIPVFHDDQHGTAVIAGAALLNALDVAKKDIATVRVVICGCGAAGFTCATYFPLLGVKREHILCVDVAGVVHSGRTDISNSYLRAVAVDTDKRTLAEAVAGADIFLGLSAGGVLTPAMLTSMAGPAPIVFALANPTPEIDPALARSLRPDVIIATGRSDYPNQVNNVLAFPFIFRGALDCRARCVNDAIKLAATRALAALARTSDGLRGSPGDEGMPPPFGPDYLIPRPTDERLLVEVSLAVAKAAMASGVARLHLEEASYKQHLQDCASAMDMRPR